MSLRVRLFLLFGGLVAVLVVGQWILVHALTRDLSAQFGEMAVSVGRGVISGVVETHIVQLRDVLEAPEEPVEQGLVEKEQGLVEKEQGLVEKEQGLVEKVKAATSEPVTEDELAEVFTKRELGKMMRDGELVEKDFTVRVVLDHDEELTADEEMGLVHQRRMVRLRQLSADGVTLADEAFELTLDQPGNASFLMLRSPELNKMIEIPRTGVKEALDRTFDRFFFGSLGILALGLLVAGMVAHRVSRPLRGLTSAARFVGEGVLGAQVPEGGGDEVGVAIRSFNRMSLRLKELDAAAKEMQAREHLTEIGEVARGMAHTLRNPLNALGLSLEELASKLPDQQESQELLESARRQIRRLDGSIRSFLAAASEGAGKVEEVNLASLAQDVALELLQDSRQRVSIEIQEAKAPPLVVGIEPELRAVVQALVVNAADASPPGEKVSIRFAQLPETKRIRMEIEDRGSGIPEEIRKRLFTPHVTTKASGSGMGLFLAHRIVTARYAGSLKLGDREQQGTVAILELGDRVTKDHV